MTPPPHRQRLQEVNEVNAFCAIKKGLSFSRDSALGVAAPPISGPERPACRRYRSVD